GGFSSDKNNALLDLAGYLGQTDAAQASRSQNVDFPAQQILQVLDQLHKLEADGTLEFDDQVDVARFLEGAEQSNPLTRPEPSLPKKA
ncbi:MAG TPA: hypothetical protein VMM92_11265, partial [Thermoanaerobaculia bacterium]|nr:hypothetical protein [Thermoanaerobaculia bacterium]